MSNKRSGPEDSATSFSTFTMKKGNDGDVWMVKETEGGIKRWIKVGICEDHGYIVTFKMKNLLDLYDQLKEYKGNYFTYIDAIPIDDMLTYWDIVFHREDDFDRSQYHIYRYEDCLVASENKIIRDKLENMTMVCGGATVRVDSGVFAFMDSAPYLRLFDFLLEYLKFVKTISRKDSKRVDMALKEVQRAKKTMNDPELDDIGLIDFNQKEDKKTRTSKLKLGDLNYWTKYNFDNLLSPEDYNHFQKKFLNEVVLNQPNRVFGVIGDTFGGDGTFEVIKDKNNKVLIQAGPYWKHILDCIYDACNSNDAIDPFE